MGIKENYQLVMKRIESVCQKNNLNFEDIKLVTVTKTHSADVVKEATAAGALYIGENKVQEAQTKLPLLEGEYEEFHLIGSLQSNKIKQIGRASCRERV